jgi:hypothetical protein
MNRAILVGSKRRPEYEEQAKECMSSAKARLRVSYEIDNEPHVIAYCPAPDA